MCVCVSVCGCVDARTDGWMEGWSECVFEGEGEGGVGHLILCSKKQRCSLQMSAAFSGAQIKSPQKRARNKQRASGRQARAAHFAGF